ncbi:MAG: DUF1761 family protein [Chitinivibrionales bacterium]|nr:DUF1761 family protein [Chitinivibrionales bacterium]MBD3356704.1 DUF1761 family protein [Chitinivibrionales bacterium]
MWVGWCTKRDGEGFMPLALHHFNVWAIAAGILANMIIGMLWYSPIFFGNIWLELIGKRREDIAEDDAGRSMALSIIPAIGMVLSVALIVAFANASTIADALIVGTTASVGLIGMSSFNLLLFENRSVKLTMLNTGYYMVALNVAAIISTLWR